MIKNPVIKYKLLYKKTNTILIPRNFRFTDGRWYIDAVSDEGKHPCWYVDIPPEDYVLLPYTGQNDINGNEIYWGQTLKVGGDDLRKTTPLHDKTSKFPKGKEYKVIYHEGGYRLSHSKKSPKHPLLSNIIYANSLTIVNDNIEISC
jgi:hypothetical protein